jgi:hypothetical protein
MIAVAEWETEATWAGPCSLVAAKKMAGATGIEADPRDISLPQLPITIKIHLFQ